MPGELHFAHLDIDSSIPPLRGSDRTEELRR